MIQWLKYYVCDSTKVYLQLVNFFKNQIKMEKKTVGFDQQDSDRMHI